MKPTDINKLIGKSINNINQLSRKIYIDLLIIILSSIKLYKLTLEKERA